MKTYNDTAPQTRIYITPAGAALAAAGQGFILATSLGVAIAVFINVAAMALHSWNGDVFWNSVLAGLLPWGFLILGLFKRLFRFGWPAIEKATNRDLDGSGAIGDPMRFIPVRGGQVRGPEEDEVYPVDLRFFIQQICGGRDHTQREWRGETMPSGVVCWNEYHAALVNPLVISGAIVERKAGAKGRLVTHDPARIEEMVGGVPLPYPNPTT